MSLEQFNRGPAGTLNADLNAALFADAYSGASSARDLAKTVDLAKVIDFGKAIGAADKQPTDGDYSFVQKKDTPTDSYEKGLEKKMKAAFKPELLENLNNWRYLINHKDDLEAGFKKLSGKDGYEIAKRICAQSKNGDDEPYLYMKKQKSATAGSLVPKRWDIMLRRWPGSDDNVGHIDI